MKIITPAQLKIAEHADKTQLRFALSGLLVDPLTQEVAATNGHVLVRVKPSKEQLAAPVPDINAVMPKGNPKAFATVNAAYLESVLKTFREVSGKDWKGGNFLRIEVWEPLTALRFSLTNQTGADVEAIIMPMRVDE